VDITKYICDYLMEYNTPVIVPELGCFTIVNKPSEIKDGIVSPPVKTVELDSDNDRDDNVLTLYMAKKENISMEQAAGEVRDFYMQFFIRRLSVERKVAFDNFGIFTLNEFGNIIFTPDTNFFKDNYGLGDAYIPGGATQTAQPDFTASTPDPAPYIPIPPVEPIIVPEPAQPITEPVQPEPESTQTIPEPAPEPEIKSEPEGSLFDTTDGTRFRENTERRRPAEDRKEEPVRPIRPAKTPPPPKKRQGQAKTGGGSSLWVLWLILAVGAVGVAAYFVYPMFTSPNTTLSTVVDTNNEAKPLHGDEPEGDTPNTEVAQTLDDATDKKNALNPTGTQQAASSTSQSKPATEPATPKTEAKPATVAQSQGNAGHGKYVLVIGSFTTRSLAETYGKKLQTAGINYEIIDAGKQRYRISVASFDDKAEAIRQANQMKSKPFCENVWVIRR
jgi:hypothetical protein